MGETVGSEKKGKIRSVLERKESNANSWQGIKEHQQPHHKIKKGKLSTPWYLKKEGDYQWVPNAWQLSVSEPGGRRSHRLILLKKIIGGAESSVPT